MKRNVVYLGSHRLADLHTDTSDTEVVLDGIPHYAIDGYDRMRPFFMSVVSSSDHWLFLSSRGGITTGRKNADHALFPYYTDDKIHDSIETTGPFTVCFVRRENDVHLWEPFADSYPGRVYSVRRRLSKSVLGNRVVFEEINETLSLTFAYRWEFSDLFGIVRTARLTNTNSRPVEVEILDGIRNVLPAGTDRTTQERASTLLDGYKHAELDGETGMAIYSLSSIITDRAEPSEALRGTTVWQAGLADPVVLLSAEQVPGFVGGSEVVAESYLRGRRGAYLLNASFELPPGQLRDWIVVADVEQDATMVEDRRTFIREMSATSSNSLRSAVAADIESGTDALRRLMAAADGLQVSTDSRTVGRHGANALFNIMRGGIFANGYQIDRDDFCSFVSDWNLPVAEEFASLFEKLPPQIARNELIEKVEEAAAGNRDLIRLVYEYLPLTFSRRHGDPSRPWNKFSIDIRTADGTPAIRYQGNWRDIFQNWEALARSYPAFLDGMVAKFLNASTADGYNPYRISRDGIDWELFDPDDPWSNIGYWGDHQIVYLQRLLELSHRFFPGKLDDALVTPRYAFADIPYRIKSFSAIVSNPHDTIIFDDEHQDAINKRVRTTGADGKLLHVDGGRYYVTMIEKLLIPLLTKVSNLVPGGGIWMNTQRPEWNDANNALVGWGLSMVTVNYLRRYVTFLLDFLPMDVLPKTVTMTNETVQFFTDVTGVLKRYQPNNAAEDASQRAEFVAAAGRLGEQFRESIYAGSFGRNQSSADTRAITELLSLIRDHLDATIATNRREDGLFHSYNLMVQRGDEIGIARLDEMLEGQVAVLSSGLLSPNDVIGVLDALRKSRLYRGDQSSYTLYPDKELPRFRDKNRIPAESISRSPFLQREAERTDGRIVGRDCTGNYHFNGEFRNARFLEEAIDRAASADGTTISPDERNTVLGIYEELFAHRSFTGRSGTFFKYEGLGSIYWHMVSKLLVAVQENYLAAADRAAEPGTLAALARYYREIREGIGVHKSARLYGAFPTDPYSHTPGFTGAQQPGMTGQVKEDIITRFGELGVRVLDGKISFDPRLLAEHEFLAEPTPFTYADASGVWKTIDVPAQAIAFTCLSVPVVYRRSEVSGVVVTFSDDTTQTFDGKTLDQEISETLFLRSGRVCRLDVDVVIKSDRPT